VTTLAPYLTIILAVVLTQVLIIYNECHETCRGYMSRALGRIWLFFTCVIALQSLLGYGVYELAIVPLLDSKDIAHRFAVAGVSGFLAVVVPNGIITQAFARYIAKPNADVAGNLDQPLRRFVLWMWVLRAFRAAVQFLKSDDNFD
jgi:hypothetical protein